MRHLMFLLVASICCAQTEGPVRPAAKEGLVTITYDEFKDRTEIRVDIKAVKISGSNSVGEHDTFRPVDLRASNFCPGRATKCPAEGAVILFEYEAGWRSLIRCDSLDVDFIADGARIHTGQCSWLGNIVVFEVPAADMTAIARAKRLRARIGLFTFNFGEENLAALRAFSEHVQFPESPKAQER